MFAHLWYKEKRVDTYSNLTVAVVVVVVVVVVQGA